MSNKARISFAAVAAATAIAGGTVVSGALATNPSGAAGALLGHGTTSGPFVYSVPKIVTVVRKVRVKTKNGKFVTRKKRVKRTVQRSIVTCSSAKPCDLVQQKLTFEPGGDSGWHRHPGVVLVVVTAGALTRYRSNCSKATFTAGQSFIELAPDGAGFVRNQGSAPAEAVQTYIDPAGKDPRIDESVPAGCNP